MTSPSFVIYQCQRPECGLRYPDTAEAKSPCKCPACRAPVKAMTQPFRHEASQEAGAASSALQIEVLLDNIRSALNLGAILRTADGAGVRRIHLCGITPTPDQPKIAKTSLGAESALPWEYQRDGLAALRAIQSRGMECWALECAPDSQPIQDAPLPSAGKPLLLVVGNERSGVDPGILAECKQVIHIPMQGVKRSLNVASAFAVAVYTLRLRAFQTLPLPNRP